MKTEKEIIQIAQDIHKSTIVVDAHHDILMDVVEKRHQGMKGRLNSYWTPKLRNGGVDVQVFPIYVDTEFLPEMALRQTLLNVEAFLADLEDDDSGIEAVFSYAEIEEVNSRGKNCRIAGFGRGGRFWKQS